MTSPENYIINLDVYEPHILNYIFITKKRPVGKFPDQYFLRVTMPIRSTRYMGLL